MQPPGVALERQLEYLNEQLKETSAAGGEFLGKFVFGGLVAVIALLNVDLVLIGGIEPRGPRGWGVLALAAALVLAISMLYFRAVARHYGTYRRSHRKLKYKYELTAHAMLMQAEAAEYQRYLEESLDAPPEEGFRDAFPAAAAAAGTFAPVASYLRDHHRVRLAAVPRNDVAPFERIAMILVLLTLAARLLGILLRGGAAG